MWVEGLRERQCSVLFQIIAYLLYLVSRASSYLLAAFVAIHSKRKKKSVLFPNCVYMLGYFKNAVFRLVYHITRNCSHSSHSLAYDCFLSSLCTHQYLEWMAYLFYLSVFIFCPHLPVKCE